MKISIILIVLIFAAQSCTTTKLIMEEDFMYYNKNKIPYYEKSKIGENKLKLQELIAFFNCKNYECKSPCQDCRPNCFLTKKGILINYDTIYDGIPRVNSLDIYFTIPEYYKNELHKPFEGCVILDKIIFSKELKLESCLSLLKANEIRYEYDPPDQKNMASIIVYFKNNKYNAIFYKPLTEKNLVLYFITTSLSIE